MIETPESRPGTFDYYGTFIEDLVNKFQWVPNPDDTVWHYTNGASLLSILDSGTLYSTQVSCLNDATEIAYSAGKLRSALIALLPGLTAGSPTAKFVERYAELLKNDPESPNHAAIEYFVTCFSSLYDDLGQWRSYAGGENGYALGFRVGSLFGMNNSLVAKVNYNAVEHQELANQVAAATVRFYEEGPADHLTWDRAYLEAWDARLTSIAPMFKDPGFRLEQEVRIVHQLQESEYSDLKILQKKSMLSRHLPLRFPLGGPTHRPKLPLKEIMIGPCRHRRITQVSIGTLLKARGYSDVPITFSNLPYQDL
jgi:hypothetical protein